MNIQMLLKLLSVILSWTLVSGVASAQQASSSRVPLKIRKLSAIGSRSLVETPQYQSDVSRSSGRSKKWNEISVLYETTPDWIDELTVEFHVLSSSRDLETKKQVYSLYKLIVRYVDIERGRDHTATAFLRPAAVTRFGVPMAVAAVFSVKGKVIDAVNEETENMPEKWWKNPQVIDRADVTVRKGYLLDRTKSPWAMINYDSYEVIK